MQKKVINKFLIYIFFFIHFSFFANATIKSPFVNMTISDVPITYEEEIKFKGLEDETVNLSNYDSDIYLINFWATWCAPCKKEMPSLDKLQSSLKKIKVFPVNIQENNKNKSKIFFKNLKIKNLQIYFDTDSKLANIFWLRGIPTTIILNKEKKEIARILGDVNFEDEKFIKWLKENK